MSNNNNTEAKLRIGIVGAGPAGLVLAALLLREHESESEHNALFDVEILERDSADRDQGAGWDLSPEAKRALERASVDWKEICREGSDTWRICRIGDRGKEGMVPSRPVANMTMPESVKYFTGAGRPESNRQAMREALLRSIGARANIRFGTQVGGIRFDDDKEQCPAVLLGPDDEPLGAFDLIVDCSGIRSPLRNLRIEDDDDPIEVRRRYYNGLTMIAGTVRDPEATLDSGVVRMLGQGSAEFVGDGSDGKGGVVILLQRYGNSTDDLRTKLMVLFARDRPGQLAEELKLGKIPRSNITRDKHPDAYDTVSRFLKASLGPAWPSAFRDAIDQMEHLQLWDFHQFPFDAKVRKDEIPLASIGDALHVMSPTSGSGGNLALQDAVDLADLLLEWQSNNRLHREEGNSGNDDDCDSNKGTKPSQHIFRQKLVPLTEKLLARTELNQKIGEWNRNRYRKVLTNPRPVEEHFDRHAVWMGLNALFGKGTEWMMGNFFHFIHWMEGFGMQKEWMTQ